MGADQERPGIGENKTFETQRKGGSGGDRDIGESGKIGKSESKSLPRRRGDAEKTGSKKSEPQRAQRNTEGDQKLTTD
jgi:hypothetical protein